jgi:hypothetical protein
MPVLTLLLLTTLAPIRAQSSSALAPLYETIPEPAEREIGIREEGMRRALEGRRLLVETQGVARRSVVTGLSGVDAVRFMRLPKPTLVFDLERLQKVSAWEFELAFARELAKAGMDIPLELPELEMAARQKELVFALDKAAQAADFSKALKSVFYAAQKRLERLQGEGPELYPPPTPAGELDRAGFYLALIEKDPDQFYWSVERDGSWSPGMVRLTELEDFMTRYGPTFAQARACPGTPYVRMGDRRYPARLLKAARASIEPGGMARIKSSLGGFEEGPAQILQERVKKWAPKLP